MAKTKESEEQVLQLTVQQTQILAAAAEQVQRANQAQQLVLSAVLAGFGISRADGIQFNIEEQTLTVTPLDAS